jgi:hypothetical protein
VRHKRDRARIDTLVRHLVPDVAPVVSSVPPVRPNRCRFAIAPDGYHYSPLRMKPGDDQTA